MRSHQKSSSKLNSEKKNSGYRADARAIVEEELGASILVPFQLTDINQDAISQLRGWSNSASTNHTNSSHWEWEKIVRRTLRRSRRVELAIWSDGVLCGLVAGRISDSYVNASIYWLESRPGVNPLSGYITMISTLYLDALAEISDCDYACIDSPAPELEGLFRRYGYDQKIKTSKKVVRLRKKIN